MRRIKAARDTSDPSVQMCRLGLDNNADIVARIKSIDDLFVNAYISSLQKNRRKRSIYLFSFSSYIYNRGVSILKLNLR
jgi:hypothetical protein